MRSSPAKAARPGLFFGGSRKRASLAPMLAFGLIALGACSAEANNSADPAGADFRTTQLLQLLLRGGSGDSAGTGAAGTGAAGSGSATVPSCNPCYLYITGAGYAPGGVHFATPAGADAFCNSDGSKPNASSYKAVLVDAATRRASTGANDGLGQIDWVLGASTAYRRPSDDFPIMTTNAQKIFVFGALTNPINAGALLYYTGLNTDWTTGTNCNNWSSAAGGVFGARGQSSTTGNVNLNASLDAPCSGAQGLLCAEQ